MKVVIGVVTVVLLQGVCASAVAVPELLDVTPEVRHKLSRQVSSVNRRKTTRQITNSRQSTRQGLFSIIPVGVRWAGERRVLEYLDTHHLSHIRSVKNHPQLADDLNNLVYELAKRNLARGSNDMELLDKLRVYVHNSGASFKAARVVLLTKMAKGGVIGVLLELPVTAAEEILHVVNERKTPREAIHDAAQDVGGSGIVFGLAKGALTAASAAGITVGAPVVVPLAVVGGATYVWVSSERIWKALDEETRAVIKAQQTTLQKTYQDYARSMRERVNTTIDWGREWIQTTMTD